MLRLHDQRFEHRDRIEWRQAALGPVAISQDFYKPSPRVLKVRLRIENLKRIILAY